MFFDDLFKDKKLDEKFIKKKESPLKKEFDEFLPKKDPTSVTRDYKKFAPGTAGWMIVWQSHPGLHEEMLEYKRKHCYVFCPIREQRISYAVCEKNQKEFWCTCEKTKTE